MVATDLEALWTGPFGDAYTERNRVAGARRAAFWWTMWERTRARTWLEVGCNAGANLRWLPSRGRFGVDLNLAALTQAPAPTAAASAAALPFGDRVCDLVFTCGLLIHIDRDRVSQVMRELARVSRRWVLLMEYGASGEEVIPWRGQEAALWRAPYGRLFQEHVPDFAFRERRFLGKETGFDRVTTWLFERRKD